MFSGEHSNLFQNKNDSVIFTDNNVETERKDSMLGKESLIEQNENVMSSVLDSGRNLQKIVATYSSVFNDNQFFFDYLKKDIKKNRKMGHLTTLK